MSDDGSARKVGRILLWLVTIGLGAAMVLAGASKFLMAEMWTTNFTSWGYPAAFSYVVGLLEVAAGLAFLVPRFATYAGALIVIIMAGAAVTLVMNPGPFGPPTVPIINIVGFAGVAWARRSVRWKPG